MPEITTFHAIPLAEKPQILTVGKGFTPALPRTDYPPCPGWLLHIYNYSGKIVYNGHTYAFHDGWVSLFPTDRGWREVYPVPRSQHVYSRFRLPGATSEHCFHMPVVWDLAEKADRFRRQFVALVSHFAENSLWAEVGLWQLLFALADDPGQILQGSDSRLPSMVRKAFRYIETNLCEPIAAEDVAVAVNLSYSHLASLFRQHVGMGIAAYVRQRKMALAEELLCNSEMPIKSIAVQIGMSDLQHFNKLVRGAFGLSPRALRQRESFRADAC